MRISDFIDRAGTAFASLRIAAPRRPIVIIQSDDWGRVGIPSLESLERLKSRNIVTGDHPWDYYGLESEDDVNSLGDVLAAARDRDGRSACLTANFIMANADLREMRKIGYREFRWVNIVDGFPALWPDKIFKTYLANIERKTFYPGLHGFTHFNITEMLRTLSDPSPQGEVARALVEEDVSYLASLTPEYSFALLTHGKPGRFLNEAEQTIWVEQGIKLFREAFGFAPRTTCAPGYRANETTFRIWNQLGLEVVQTAGGLGIGTNRSLLVLSRNVEFEPALRPNAVLDNALAQAQVAVASGSPIIVCSHSINYVSRYLGRAEQSREMLRAYLSRLLQEFPDLRFASDAELADAYKKNVPLWFRPPNAGELWQRMTTLFRRNWSSFLSRAGVHRPAHRMAKFAGRARVTHQRSGANAR